MTPAAAAPLPVGTLMRRSSGEQAALYVRRLIFDGELRPGARHPPGRSGCGTWDEPTARSRSTDRGRSRRLGHARGTTRSVRELTRQAGGARSLRAPRNDLRLRRREGHRSIGGSPRRPGTVDARAPRRGRLGRCLAIDGAVPSPDHRLHRLTSHPSDAASDVRNGSGNYFELVPASAQPIRQGLRAIKAAVAKGDAERASAAYRRTLTAEGDLVVDLLESRGLFDAAEADPR